MSETVAYLTAVVGADISAYRRGMSEVRNDLGIMATNIEGLGRVGQQLSFAVTLPLALAAGAIIKTSADFEAAMYNVASISDEVANNFTQMSRDVLEFGANTRTGAQAAAEALYEIYSVGYRGDAFDLMTISVNTAEAGLADLATTTRALANVLNAYSSVGLQAADASNVLTRTVQLGAGTLEEYATSIGRVAPAASALGISFDELGANWAFITQQGAGVSTAATELANIMNKLLKPSTELEAVFKDMGVSGGIELIDKFGGLNGAIKALYDSAGSNPEVFAQMFGNQRAIRGILKMTNSIEEWDAAIAQFYEGLDTATMTAWEQQTLSMSASFDRLISAAQGVAIHIGQQLIPVLKPVVDGVRDIILSLLDLDPALIQVGATFAFVVAAAGPLLWLLSSLVSPFGILAGAVAALAVAFATNFNGIRDTVTNAVNSVFGDVSGLTGGIQTIIDAIFDTGGADGSAIQGPMERWADANAVEVGVSTFVTVKEGDTLWDIFNSSEAFKNAFTWEEFKKVIGLENPNLIHPGDILEIPATAGAETRDMVQQGFDFENAFKIDPNDWGGDTYTPIKKDLGTRLSAAISEAWPQIRDGISGLFTSIGTWVIDEGIPSLSRSLGNVVGTVGKIVVDILTGLGKAMQGKDAGAAVNDLVTYFGENVWRPFVEGIEASIGDVGGGDGIVTAFFGVIGTAMVAKAATGFLAGKLVMGIGAVAKTVVGGGMLSGLKALATVGMTMLDSVFLSLTGATLSATAMSSLKVTLMTALGSAAAAVSGGIVLGSLIYFSLPPEVKQALQNAIDGLVEEVFGVADLSGHIQAGFAEGMYNLAAGVADIVGNTEAANKLRGYAQSAAGDYIEGFTEALAVQGPEVNPYAYLNLDMDPQRQENVSNALKENFRYAVVNGWQQAWTETQPTLQAGGSQAIGAVATGMTEGVTTNAETIQWAADAMVTPIADTITTQMSEGGPILSVVDGFASSYTTQMDAVATSSEGIGGTVDSGLSAISAAVVTWAGGIITRVAGIAAAFRDMVEAATGASNAASTFGSGGGSQGRAIGGPVVGMQPYLVGEHGPELFVPNVSGVVQTASMTSGNRGQRNQPAQVTNVFNITGVANIDDFIRETKRRGWQK